MVSGRTWGGRGRGLRLLPVSRSRRSIAWPAAEPIATARAGANTAALRPCQAGVHGGYGERRGRPRAGYWRLWRRLAAGTFPQGRIVQFPSQLSGRLLPATSQPRVCLRSDLAMPARPSTVDCLFMFLSMKASRPAASRTAMAARMSKIPATDTPTMRITLLVIGWLGVQVPSSAPICCGHRPPARRMSRRWALGACASHRNASWRRPELGRHHRCRGATMSIGAAARALTITPHRRRAACLCVRRDRDAAQ